MDHQSSSRIPFTSFLDEPDYPDHCPPTMPYAEVYTTQSLASVDDSAKYLIPDHPISALTYNLIPDIVQQGSASMQQVGLSSSSIPSQDNRYHHHHRLHQSLIPTNVPYEDNKHSAYDHDWTQFALPTNENQTLQMSDRNDISPLSPLSQPEKATASMKCEWKGCTFPRPFRRYADLMRHIKTIHVSPDAYKCSVCGKGFGRKDKLEVHHRTHTHPRK